MTEQQIPGTEETMQAEQSSSQEVVETLQTERGGTITIRKDVNKEQGEIRYIQTEASVTIPDPNNPEGTLDLTFVFQAQNHSTTDEGKRNPMMLEYGIQLKAPGNESHPFVQALQEQINTEMIGMSMGFKSQSLRNEQDIQLYLTNVAGNLLAELGRDKSIKRAIKMMTR